MTSSDGFAASPVQTSPEMRAQVQAHSAVVSCSLCIHSACHAGCAYVGQMVHIWLTCVLILQAIHGAFARFRSRHCLQSSTQPGLSKETSLPTDEAESAAIGMLHHVAATAASPSSDDEAELQQGAAKGLKSIPSQQSDLPSLASAEAEQGSADRSASCSTSTAAVDYTPVC